MIKLTPANKSKISGVFRAAVRSQIASWKAWRLQNNPHCDMTGEQLTLESATVHHDPEFSVLWTQFCQEIQIDPADLPIDWHAQGYPCLSDLRITAAWRQYHHRHAQLALVHQDAHARHHGQEPGRWGEGGRKAKEIAHLEERRLKALIAKYADDTPDPAQPLPSER